MADPARPVQDAWIDPVWGQWVHDRIAAPFALFGGAGGPIPNGGFINVYWTSIYDPFNMHESVTYPWRVTVPQSGIYHVDCSTSWNAGGMSGQRYADIQINGVTPQNYPIGSSMPPTTTGSPTNMLSGDIAVVAGQYVHVRVFQDSGASLNLAPCRFSIRKVGEIPTS